MSIRVTCPHCGKTIMAPNEAAGRVARCMACDGQVRIPAAGASSTAGQNIDFDMPDSAEPAPAEAQQRVKVCCGSCGKTLSVPAQHAGKSVKCPNCHLAIKVQVPAVPGRNQRPNDGAVDFDALLTAPAAKPKFDPNDPLAYLDDLGMAPVSPSRLPPVVQGVKKKPRKKPEDEVTFSPDADDVGDWTRIFLYAYMAVAMIPLAVSLFLPEAALGGAHLPKESKFHWVYAAISAVGFLTLLVVSIRSPDAGPLLLVVVGLFTGTIGIVLLLVLQAIAFFAAGLIIGGPAIVVFFMLIVRFIGLMYYYALSPDSSFWASFYGFTLGVGLCEEVCKIIPVIWYLQNNRNATWKGACLVGLASGIGFGVSEGVYYSAYLYNGEASWEIYVVRFVSCVALHAAWTATIACTMFRRTDLSGTDFGELIWAIMVWIGMPVLLHGLYDTLLKHELHGWALATTVLTIGWMAFSVERAARSTAT